MIIKTQILSDKVEQWLVIESCELLFMENVELRKQKISSPKGGKNGH